MGAYTDFLPYNSPIPDVMRHDVMPHALRLVTIWGWDAHAVDLLLTRFATWNVPAHGRSAVLPGVLSRAQVLSTASTPAPASLPNPQFNEHRTVVEELSPHRFVGLAVGHLAEGGAIDPGQDPPVDDDMINELGEFIVPAADRHVLRQRGEIGVGGLAIVQVSPDPVPRLIEPAVEVPQDDERRWPLRRLVDPALQDRPLCQQRLTGRAGRGVLETPVLQTPALEKHQHQLDGLAVRREVDPGAIAPAAVAPNILRRKVGLAYDREPAAMSAKPVCSKPTRASADRWLRPWVYFSPSPHAKQDIWTNTGVETPPGVAAG